MDLSKHVNTKYINLNVCSQAGKIISTQYNGSYIHRHDNIQYITKTSIWNSKFKKRSFLLIQLFRLP